MTTVDPGMKTKAKSPILNGALLLIGVAVLAYATWFATKEDTPKPQKNLRIEAPPAPVAKPPFERTKLVEFQKAAEGPMLAMRAKGVATGKQADVGFYEPLIRTAIDQHKTLVLVALTEDPAIKATVENTKLAGDTAFATGYAIALQDLLGDVEVGISGGECRGTCQLTISWMPFMADE